MQVAHYSVFAGDELQLVIYGQIITQTATKLFFKDVRAKFF